MATVMFIDTARYRWFFAIACFSLFIIFCSFLLGFLGPSSRKSIVDYAYECPNDSHIYTPLCTGVQLGEPNSYYLFELPELTALNGFWSTIVYPYNIFYDTTSVDGTLIASVDIYGRKDSSYVWENIYTDEIESEVLLCDENHQMCWGFVLIYESTIKYPFYLLNVTFPDSYSDNTVSKPYIGDVAFEYQWYNEAYIEEEMSLRILYLLFATLALFIYWLRMRKTPFKEWSIEQISVGALLIGLIFLNNPLFAFEFVVPGSFFPIVDCFFQVIHQGILFLYWIFLFDYLRKNTEVGRLDKFDYLKIAVVLSYSLLCFVLFTWFRIVDHVDPVFGETQNIFGLVVLFFFCAVLFGAIVVWIILLMILGVPVIMKQPTLKARYCMVAIPTVIVLLSVIIGLFFGIFGPVERNAPAFVYFYTMYNLYVYILMLGYWPVESSFRGGIGNPSEVTPIFGTESNYSEFSQDDTYLQDEDL